MFYRLRARLGRLFRNEQAYHGIDRRCLKSRPFDETPRRRITDVGLLIAEHEGTGRLFLCRDGHTRAVVRRIDYLDDYHPVKGYVIIRRPGTTVRVEYEWLCNGGAFALHRHNWDLVGVLDEHDLGEVAA